MGGCGRVGGGKGQLMDAGGSIGGDGFTDAGGELVGVGGVKGM